ncbi:zinc-ribbon domain-containing protein [Candidatus Pelagibacter sp.]|nr:zinc-ribbon domain-containing protein [Candidatus Pelagibacter sp.]
MIIECINCNKKFNVNADLIPKQGRQIQCGSCNHIWYFKIERSLKEPLILEDEDNQNNLSIAKDIKEIKEGINIEKSTELLKDNEIYRNNKNQENISTENNIKISKISDFFSYLLVFLISFVALIILLDTLKFPLINVFPGLEIILFNLFETLKDVKLFIIDLT